MAGPHRGAVTRADDTPLVEVRARDPWTILLLGLAAGAGVLAASLPLWWREELPLFLFWEGILGGVGLLAAGVFGLLWRSPPTFTRLMFVSAALYFASYAVLAPGALLYTFGLFVTGYWMPFAGHAIVAFPEGRLRSRLERGVVGAAYVWSTIARAGAFFSDLRERGCDACPQNLLLVRHDPDIINVLVFFDTVVPILVASLVVVVLVRRWRRATTPERRVLNPLYVALGVNVLLAIALYAALGLQAAGVLTFEQLEAVALVQQFALVLIPIGLIVGVVRNVLARSAVGNLLVRIGQGVPLDELERDIAWLLADPGARIVRGARIDGADVSTDAAGVTVVGDDEGGAVAIVHDPSLKRYRPQLLTDVAAATRLALENQRLLADATLSQSVPAGLAERLQREGGRIGDVRTITISVLMSDIRDYSTIAELADLRTLAQQLNEHRAAMNKVISARRGVVMQFVGDSVFAIFGAPDPVDDHARMAVEAAIEMQRAQRELNARWKDTGFEPFRIGIGVTTGPVAAALLGSSEHVEYSVVGDVVNLAQRLQAWATDGEVVISETTQASLGGEISTEPMPEATVKGRQAPVRAHRIAVDALARLTS